MQVIIEEYPYPADKVNKVLYEGAFQSVDGKVSIGYVGYYWNDKLKDAVFFLPKVLLDEKDKVFGKYTPEEVIDLDKSPLTKKERDFVYGFAVWIYRALVVYKNANPQSRIIFHEFVTQAGAGKKRKSNTFLDVLLSLIDFLNRNRDFVMFTAKLRRSGFNKINWTKTVAKKTPVFSSAGVPVYGEVVNRKKEIDREEELLVIFHSILCYIRKEFGFDVKTDLNYDVITGPKFKRYLNGMGAARLRAIKYKYFSDKLLELWNLCYVFFEHSHRISLSSARKEYLLAKNFNIVFEGIIDALIGVPRSSIPKGLADQEDGKFVDHMFSAKSLCNNDDETRKIYYIGDSKYYKRSNSVGGVSVAKQFTYARNVIQWNMNLFLDEKPGDAEERKKFPKLRDDVTEGYNIIPNFFISAMMDKDFNYRQAKVQLKGGANVSSRHFENRLYDRDTLLIAHYDVNFLFVLSLYARNSAGQKAEWKAKIRQRFREDIQKILSERYNFYAMTPYAQTDAEAFFKEHFQLLLGKVFTPYNDVHEKTTFYSMALVNHEKLPAGTAQEFRDRIIEENEAVLECVSDAFEIAPCALGENPANKVTPHEPAAGAVVPHGKLTRHYLDNYLDEFILFGCIKDNGGKHENWIFNERNKYKRCDVYNVRLGARPGAVKKSRPQVRTPRFIVLYTEADDTIYRVFRVRSSRAVKNEKMKQMNYPGPVGDYFCYFLDEEISLGSLDVPLIRKSYRHLSTFAHPCAPLYLSGRQVFSVLSV